MNAYVFDGTFPGLLTAVFESYERQTPDVILCSVDDYQPLLLGDTVTVATVEEKARRVWNGLAKRLEREWMARLYAAFLAEQPSGYQHVFSLVRLVFDHGGAVVGDYRNPHVLGVSQLDRKVHREKHRMEAFVRFQQLVDGLYYATVDPDFNVLPLIARHFQNRYADQRWVIYDVKRRYGMYYDGDQVDEVTFSETPTGQGSAPQAHPLTASELLYQQLWRAYFDHAGIPSRKNTKLHIQHVPKRYWKYLTEKQPVPFQR